MTWTKKGQAARQDGPCSECGGVVCGKLVVKIPPGNATSYCDCGRTEPVVGKKTPGGVMDEKRLEERAKAEGFAMGVRWARRRFGEAIEDTFRTVKKSMLSDDDWIPGVQPFRHPSNVHTKPYANLQLSPLTDAEVDSIAADMKQASNEDTDIPF